MNVRLAAAATMPNAAVARPADAAPTARLIGTRPPAAGRILLFLALAGLLAACQTVFGTLPPGVDRIPPEHRPGLECPQSEHTLDAVRTEGTDALRRLIPAFGRSPEVEEARELIVTINDAGTPLPGLLPPLGAEPHVPVAGSLVLCVEAAGSVNWYTDVDPAGSPYAGS